MLTGVCAAPDADLDSLLQDHVVADDGRQTDRSVRALRNDKKKDQQDQDSFSLRPSANLRVLCVNDGSNAEERRDAQRAAEQAFK